MIAWLKSLLKVQYQNPIIEQNLVQEEGIILSVYKDSKGLETIGIGTCIAPGIGRITLDEAYYLLRNRIALAFEQLNDLDWFKSLDQPRQNVLIEMVFNLGFDGTMKFKDMISAIKGRDFRGASIAMVKSQWFNEEPARVNRLAERMWHGSD